MYRHYSEYRCDSCDKVIDEDDNLKILNVKIPRLEKDKFDLPVEWKFSYVDLCGECARRKFEYFMSNMIRESNFNVDN